MVEQLLLPAPKPQNAHPVLRAMMVGMLFITLSVFSAVVGHFLLQPSGLASLLFENSVERVQEPDIISMLRRSQMSLVKIIVDGQDVDVLRLNDLFKQQAVSSLPELIDAQKWQSVLNDVKLQVEKIPMKPDVVWVEGKGWQEQAYQQEVRLDPQSLGLAQASLLEGLVTLRDTIVLSLKTTSVAEAMSDGELSSFEQKRDSFHDLLATPLTLHIGDSVETLDLNREKDFVTLHGSAAEINDDKIKSWITDLDEKYHRDPSTVTIVGREEVRKGVFKAITKGEFVEGSHILVDDVTQQVLEALKGSERDLTIKQYELPVKVVSDLDHSSYDLLAVGYSEYSTGNDHNRVHNLTTGLRKLNGTLIDPGQEISFNRIIGEVNNDFVMGWGIFGTVALPVLGGGLCQVSTTLYRALLNLGVPITARQNHSWDLTYYQKGGYGLDATVFPEKGVDVKAINDFDSQLLIYSYTRPETEEAYVLIYGKGDGRKVTLKPEMDYVPTHGSKTIKWQQTIELPDGEVKENEISSHYRA